MDDSSFLIPSFATHKQYRVAITVWPPQTMVKTTSAWLLLFNCSLEKDFSSARVGSGGLVLPHEDDSPFHISWNVEEYSRQAYPRPMLPDLL